MLLRCAFSFKLCRFSSRLSVRTALQVPTIPTIFSEVPANLPPPDQIITLCKEAGYNSDGIAFADPSFREVLA